MPVEIVNLKKDKSDLISFVEKSLSSLTDFSEYVKSVEDENRSTSLSGTRYLRSSSSKKRKRPVTVLNISNPEYSTTINSNNSSNNSNIENEFIIEDVSDDEPKPKRTGLCKNQKVYNRNLISLNKSHPLNRNSTNKLKKVNLNQSFNSNISTRSQTKLSLNKASADKVSSKSSNEFLDKSKIRSPSKHKKLLVSHSTPKISSRVQNKLDQIIKDHSPFEKSNIENFIDVNSESPLKPIVRQKTNQCNKARKLFNSTNSKFHKETHLSTSSPVKALSQTIEVPDSPVANDKVNRNQLKLLNYKNAKESVKFHLTRSATKKFETVEPSKTATKTNCQRKLVSLISDVTPTKQKKQDQRPVELTCSQQISEVESPKKGQRSRAVESRCFLKVSKKVEKLINNHNAAKLSESKHAEIKQQNMTYNLIETIHKKLEERKRWLSLNKNDQIEHKSLFIKLTKVNEPRNGFVECEFQIDLDRMKEVIIFKHSKLRTTIPVHYSDQIEISTNALFEYLSPWTVIDIDDLKISYVINPFWIHILDHGKNESKSEWEVVYNVKNPLST